MRKGIFGAYTNSKDPDQPARLYNLIISNDSVNERRRLWAKCAEAHADLGLRSKGIFARVGLNL